MANNLPAPVSGDAGGYQDLFRQMSALEQTADLLAEHAEALKSRMQRNAKAADRLGDLCAAAEVAAVDISGVGDIATAFGRVARGGARIVAAAERVGVAAAHVRTTHRCVYGQIREVATSLPGGRRQPKPGFNRVI